jgi:hypothetical protein
MRIDRRNFVRTGLVSAASLAAACRSASPNSDTAPAAGPGSAPAATVAPAPTFGMDWRFKGLFAYIKVGGRWIAQPAYEGQAGVHAHQLRLQIAASYVDGALDPKEWRLKGGWWFRTAPVGFITVTGAEAVPLDEPAARAAAPTAPADGPICPSGDPGDDGHWKDAWLIAGLSRLGSLKLSPQWKKHATFAMQLPADVSFEPRAPLEPDHQQYIWAFRDKNGDGSEKGVRQAMTDVVSVRLRFPAPGGTLTIYPAFTDGAPAGSPSHVRLKDGKSNIPAIWMISSQGREAEFPLRPGDKLPDFALLYSLLDPKPTILPVLLDQTCQGQTRVQEGPPTGDGTRRGGDVFCAGGEIDQSGG